MWAALIQAGAKVLGMEAQQTGNSGTPQVISTGAKTINVAAPNQFPAADFLLVAALGLLGYVIWKKVK